MREGTHPDAVCDDIGVEKEGLGGLVGGLPDFVVVLTCDEGAYGFVEGFGEASAMVIADRQAIDRLQ